MHTIEVLARDGGLNYTNYTINVVVTHEAPTQSLTPPTEQPDMLSPVVSFVLILELVIIILIIRTYRAGRTR